MFDVIGDIHGQADALIALLEELGYRKERGAYRHPDRTAVFVGDFVDRGPRIKAVLETVRPMVEEVDQSQPCAGHQRTRIPARVGVMRESRRVENDMALIVHRVVKKPDQCCFIIGLLERNL